MLNYEIWQMPVSNPNKYMHFDWCKNPINIKDYVLVYESQSEELKSVDNLLEDIFEKLNVDHPKDYYAASLSVSDVVCLIRGSLREWWYVDGIGFKKLNW